MQTPRCFFFQELGRIASHRDILFVATGYQYQKSKTRPQQHHPPSGN